MEPAAPTFEDSFNRLQAAIDRLEAGGLPLEAALALFEESMGLAATCHQILDRAELRLTRLVDEQAAAFGGEVQE